MCDRQMIMVRFRKSGEEAQLTMYRGTVELRCGTATEMLLTSLGSFKGDQLRALLYFEEKMTELKGQGWELVPGERMRRVCPWCEREEVDGVYLGPPAVIQRGELVTHGICPTCYQRVMAEEQ